MPHVVPRHTASPRTSPGPRNPVPQDTGRAQEHHRDSQPMVGAPAHGRCSGAWSVLKPIASAKPMVGTQAHGQCSGAWSVPRPIVGTHSPWSVLRPIVGAQAYGRYAQPMVGAHTEKPRTGAQHHARLGPTRGCRRRPPASAPLPLPGAPDPWRSASKGGTP
jgi:hypothetical protein